MTKKLSTTEFIERSKSVHGDLYDYKFAEYSMNKKKLTIVCREHGQFEQRPDHHLSGVGCPKCANNIKKNIVDFITEAKLIHGEKFDYSKAIYDGQHTPIIIICPIHGEYNQTPSNHLQNRGCDKCRSTSHSDSNTFIESAMKIHGEKYSYNNVNYSTAHKKVAITCHDHGDFEQTPNSHLNGSGCPNCAITGFGTDKNAYGYILKFNNFIKFGITNNIQNRLRTHRQKNGEFEVLKIKEFEFGKDALNWENSIKKKFGGKFVDKSICPDGFTETLPLDLEITLIEGL